MVVFKLQKLFICEDYQDKRNNYRLLLVTELIFCNKEEGTRVILTSGVAYTKNNHCRTLFHLNVHLRHLADAF